MPRPVEGEPDTLEGRKGLLIGQPKHLSDAQAPCEWGNEEVLRHATPTNYDEIEYNR